MNTYLTERQKSWLTLVSLWLLLLLLAALRPLAVPDEGRYGEIGRWMLFSGDWLTPRLNGLPFFHKPPYVYWLEAMSLATFGVNAWALRLVPALHAGLMLLVLYLSARHLSSETTARRAVLMLGTSLTFLVGGQYVNHDMAVATWIGVAIWCFALAFMAGDKPHAWLARLGFIACALGVLSKGLIGLALPGLVILVWLLWTRQLKKILYLPWLSGLALFALIAMPWFIVAQQKYPELFNYMVIGQQLNRYTASTYNNPQPFWFYLLALVLLFFPWVFFALGQWRRSTRLPARAAELLTLDGWRLCWVWIGAIFIFFSIPNSKLVGYILPVMPALALLAALGWGRVMAHRAHAGRIFVGLCLLNIGIALAIVTLVGGVTRTGRAQDVAAVLACQARLSDTIYASGAFPYDLPFYVQTHKPLVMLEDWPALRINTGDGWQRELFEGADFDPQAAQVLQPRSVLAPAGLVAGNWFVVRPHHDIAKGLPGWTLYYQGAGWLLYQSAQPLAAKSPVPTEQKGLPGCKDQGRQ
ncbi:MAG: 4-amino-4-deoxy-L-arabinose transferase-like glycosyltransferase [Rhodoferax sp.]